MSEDNLKQVTSDEAKKLVQDIYNEMTKIVYEKLEGIHRGQAWLIAARAMNQQFHNFYGVSLSEGANLIAKEQAKYDAEKLATKETECVMTDDMTKRRNQIAKVYKLNCDDTMSLEDHCEDAVKKGWDACQAEMQAQVDELRSDRDKFFDMYHELDKQVSELEKERDSLKSALDVAVKAF